MLPAEARSAARARLLVTEACQHWGTEEVCSDAALVVTELVANAVRHAGTEVTVQFWALEREPGGVRTEVTDGSIRPLRPRPATELLEEGGRGLFLVDALATRWGADAGRHGKTVWAEIVPDAAHA